MEIGDVWGVLNVLAFYAALAVEKGHLERALDLDGAASALAEATGVPIAAVFSQWTSPYLARARKALGPTAAEAARQKGRAMTLEQAVDFALRAEAEK
jgi:hypothetical protein